MMNKKIWSLLLATSSFMTACTVASPAVEDKGLNEGFSTVDKNTVKLVEKDPITQDAYSNRGVIDKDAYTKISYYFKINKDSSVVVVRGWQEDVTFNPPILYKDMEPSVQQKFSKSVEYAKSYPR